MDLTDLPNNGPSARDLAAKAISTPSAFKAVADGALGDFKASHALALDAIRKGDLTPKAARESLGRSALAFREWLASEARGFSAGPPYFTELVRRTSGVQAAAKAAAGPEATARETNDLLRSVLVEQKISNRRSHYEAEARAGDLGRKGDEPATVAGMLAFLERAKRAGDDAAAEWGKRELGALRRTTGDPEAQAAIRDALVAPGEVADHLVERHLEALRNGTTDQRAAFAADAVKAADASQCVAAFVACRELAAAGQNEPWTTVLLGSMHERFPAAAVDALVRDDAEARRTERESAMIHAEHASAMAAEMARLDNVTAPTDQELLIASRMPKGPGQMDPGVR